MSTKLLKTFAAAAVMLLAAACTDLLVEPKSTVTAANIFNDPGAYRAFIAKIYAGLAVTGQSGPAGNADINDIDEGFSHYIRLWWQMEELPTDEVGIAWNDAGVQELNTQGWASSNPFTSAMYNRIYFQVTLANEFLRETTGGKLSERGTSVAIRADVKTYRAEARFLRALSYSHGMDLFGNIPLVTEADQLGATPPAQATRAQIFNYIESELKAIRPDLPAPKTGQYGRVDQTTVDLLLARIFLNAQVYAGTPRYADALTSASAVIASPYTIDGNYRRMFLADNNTSPEIIWAIPQDGLRIQSYGGTTFLTHASVGGNMNAGSYGLDGGWWGLRMKPEVYNLFPGSGADRRSNFFFTSGQSPAMNNLTNFFDGIAAPKYANVTSTGAPGSNPNFADTDYPMFRLGEAYLIYAEAQLRGGGGTRAQALTYINALRTRAYGNPSGNIVDAQMTLPFILDERARELLWEGHRRTDLVRFDKFTNNGIWMWKGGIRAGRVTDPHLNLYPLPAAEILANPTLKQNTGY